MRSSFLGVGGVKMVSIYLVERSALVDSLTVIRDLRSLPGGGKLLLANR